MKILITGASGFIGSYLSEYCAHKNNEVHLCDNNARGKNDEFINKILNLENTKFIKADLTKRHSAIITWLYHL